MQNRLILTLWLVGAVLYAGSTVFLAHAVLGGERTFELTHQRGSFVCDLPEFFQIGGAVHIEHRSHMQKSAGGMSIIARCQPQRFHD